jgi:mono/diheme cytochrome c family protein
VPAVLSPSPLPAHSTPTLRAARTAGSAFSLTLALALAAPSLHASLLTAEQRATLPPAATRPVDFVRDIQPIFEASCVQCHGRGKAKGSFSIETRADFLAGGDRGEPIVPGDSAHSLVVEMISGLSPDDVMPEKGKRLTAEQVALFRAWIDQGLAWPDSVNFHRHEPANLRPREVGTPSAAPGLEHPLDRWVDRYFRAQGAAWPAVVFARPAKAAAWTIPAARVAVVDMAVQE